MKEVEKSMCARCGRNLGPRETGYRVKIEVTACFDGTIEVSGGHAADQAMWKEIEEKSERELMNEVVSELEFMLCRPCRDRWIRAPFGDPGPCQTEPGVLPH